MIAGRAFTLDGAYTARKPTLPPSAKRPCARRLLGYDPAYRWPEGRVEVELVPSPASRGPRAPGRGRRPRGGGPRPPPPGQGRRPRRPAPGGRVVGLPPAAAGPGPLEQARAAAAGLAAAREQLEQRITAATTAHARAT